MKSVLWSARCPHPYKLIIIVFTTLCSALSTAVSKTLTAQRVNPFGLSSSGCPSWLTDHQAETDEHFETSTRSERACVCAFVRACLRSCVRSCVPTIPPTRIGLSVLVQPHYLSNVAGCHHVQSYGDMRRTWGLKCPLKCANATWHGLHVLLARPIDRHPPVTSSMYNDRSHYRHIDARFSCSRRLYEIAI